MVPIRGIHNPTSQQAPTYYPGIAKSSQVRTWRAALVFRRTFARASEKSQFHHGRRECLAHSYPTTKKVNRQSTITNIFVLNSAGATSRQQKQETIARNVEKYTLCDSSV